MILLSQGGYIKLQLQTLSRIQHAITFWFRWIWCVSLFQEQINTNSTIKAILMSLPAWALDSRTQDRSNLSTPLPYLLTPGVSFASTQLSDPAHSLNLPCSHSSRFRLVSRLKSRRLLLPVRCWLAGLKERNATRCDIVLVGAQKTPQNCGTYWVMSDFTDWKCSVFLLLSLFSPEAHHRN